VLRATELHQLRVQQELSTQIFTQSVLSLAGFGTSFRLATIRDWLQSR